MLYQTNIKQHHADNYNTLLRLVIPYPAIIIPYTDIIIIYILVIYYYNNNIYLNINISLYNKIMLYNKNPTSFPYSGTYDVGPSFSEQYL